MAERIVTAEIEGGKKLEKYLRGLASRLSDGGEVSVGFFENATYPAEDGGLPVAQVAFWNEYGTTNDDGSARVPPRPFMKKTVEDNAETWPRKLGAAARYTGYRTKPTLEIMGAELVGQMRLSLRQLNDPPNAPATIKKKGFDKPLFDTGRMEDDITWLVNIGRPVKE